MLDGDNMGGPMRTLSMTTGWFVRTSSYSVDIQRWLGEGEGMEWGLCVEGVVSSWAFRGTMQSRLASSDASVGGPRVPEISQHDMQTPLDIPQFYPSPLPLFGAVLFAFSTLSYSYAGLLLAPNSRRAQ
jgi:hypothetical protein